MIKIGYSVPWINSTLVVSAWVGACLIGAVRVLSDTMFRSIIYDLLVLPEYQNRGIGTELIRRCIEHFPDSEWLVQTREEISGYYKKLGFTVINDKFLSVPCKLFTP
jgi:ribosomal protein S18 acetylase RimI-like enzyme